MLDGLNMICERLVIEYQRHAPASRRSITLWETLNLLAPVLTYRTRIKPVRSGNTIAMLEPHLRANSLG